LWPLLTYPQTQFSQKANELPMQAKKYPSTNDDYSGIREQQEALRFAKRQKSTKYSRILLNIS
jgi:hypothetical protein